MVDCLNVTESEQTDLSCFALSRTIVFWASVIMKNGLRGLMEFH